MNPERTSVEASISNLREKRNTLLAFSATFATLGAAAIIGGDLLKRKIDTNGALELVGIASMVGSIFTAEQAIATHQKIKNREDYLLKNKG